jgi:hypothetical protein
MTVVVLYHGQEVAADPAIKNVKPCGNPFCKKLVQTRPERSTLAGRPKAFCGEKCRWKWKRKRRTEKKYRERMLKEMH